MTDLEIAKTNLQGHTICLCKDGNCIFSEKKGIAPMMDFIADGVKLANYSVADLVVGKAAAMLFVKCGIKQVFAKTVSQSGLQYLSRHGIECEYDVLAEKIVNRAGTDICPMEKAVLNIDGAEEGFFALKATLESMRANS